MNSEPNPVGCGLKDPGPTLFTLKNLYGLCNFIFESGSTHDCRLRTCGILGENAVPILFLFYLALFYGTPRNFAKETKIIADEI